MTDDKSYQITEKDIESVLKVLHVNRPNVTREEAIELLENLKASIHMMNHEDPKTLAKLYDELQKQKELIRN